MHRLDNRSRMSGDVHVRFCESLRGRFPRATRLVVFGRTRQQMKQELRIIEHYLGEQLDLVLHSNRQLNQSSLGMTFLGFRVLPGIIRLSSARRRRIIQKCRGYDKQINSLCSEQLVPCLQSMLAVTEPAAATGFRRMLFEKFRVLFQEQQPGDTRRFVC